MRALLDSTWSKVQARVQARVGRAVYTSWIADLRPIALERGVMLFEAPTQLVCEQVRQYHLDSLAEVLSAEIGTRIEVTVLPRRTALVPGELDVGPARPIIDAGNATAWHVLQALHDGRELPSSLFLFHGGPGVGKTFLLRWWRQVARRPVKWFDGLELVGAMRNAVHQQRSQELRAELTGDFDLMIDEVHRLAGHGRVQRELAAVLAQRAESPNPTLIASRWHPHEIRDIDPVLQSWLLAGFVTSIEPPGLEARLAYLRALEGPRSSNGRADNVERLAQEVVGGFPELRRRWAVDQHGDRRLQEQYYQFVKPRVTFERLRDAVAARFDVTVDELVGKCQKRRVSRARKILCHLCVREGLSQSEVGRYLGKTRAAVSAGIASLGRLVADDAELRRTIEDWS